jgi:hypothetical protein
VIVWTIVALYAVVGIVYGRFAARAAYRWTRREYPLLSAGNAKHGLTEAAVALLGTVAAWPLILLYLVGRRVVLSALAATVPEYRFERNKQLEAELEAKIRVQRREIERLDREINGGNW